MMKLLRSVIIFFIFSCSSIASLNGVFVPRDSSFAKLLSNEINNSIVLTRSARAHTLVHEKQHYEDSINRLMERFTDLLNDSSFISLTDGQWKTVGDYIQEQRGYFKEIEYIKEHRYFLALKNLSDKEEYLESFINSKINQKNRDLEKNYLKPVEEIFTRLIKGNKLGALRELRKIIEVLTF